jgi:hypothetical protein
MKRLFGLILIAPLSLVACTRAAETPAAPPAPQPKAYGNLAQVMQAIPFPASNIIFDTQGADPGAAKEASSDPAASGATAQFSGVYGGWLAVENAAVAIQETANLIMIPGRTCQNGKPVPNDQENFKKWAADLAAVAADIQKVAQTKSYNADTMLDVSDKLTTACLNCHEKYRDTPNAPADRCMP